MQGTELPLGDYESELQAAAAYDVMKVICERAAGALARGPAGARGAPQPAIAAAPRSPPQIKIALDHHLDPATLKTNQRAHVYQDQPIFDIFRGCDVASACQLLREGMALDFLAGPVSGGASPLPLTACTLHTACS